MSLRFHNDIRSFDHWIHEILASVKSRLGRFHNNHGRSFSLGARKYLRFLQTHLVICPIDKAFNNAGFICRRLYASIMHDEFVLNGAYSIAVESCDEVLERHKTFLKPRCLWSPGSFGYVYPAMKMHKQVPTQRFIAALFNCSLTKCARMLHAALKVVLASLRLKDDDLVAATGLKRFSL